MTPAYFSHPKQPASSHPQSNVVGRPFIWMALAGRPLAASTQGESPSRGMAGDSCETTWPPSTTGAAGSRQAPYPATARSPPPVCHMRASQNLPSSGGDRQAKHRRPLCAIPGVHLPFVPMTAGFPAGRLAPLRRCPTSAGWSKPGCDVRKKPVYLPPETVPLLQCLKNE